MTDAEDSPTPSGSHGRRTYLLSYETRPNDLLPERDAIGGAFVSCWIVGRNLDEVKEQASRHLESTGWTKVAVIAEQAVAAGSIPDAAREHYEQAQIDGEVYVIHVFPPEPPDA